MSPNGHADAGKDGGAGLPALSIKRHVFAYMLSGVLLLFGIISYDRIGVDRFPRIEFPMISVQTVLPGASPEIMDATLFVLDQLNAGLEYEDADAGLVAARLKLARLLLAQKQEDAARAELKSILAQKPSHRQAQALLASLEQRQQPPEEKKKETPAQPGEPTTYQGWLKLASRQLDAGATRKALASYDRALKLRPDGAAALAGKGLCYLDAGSNAAAILWFGKALRADPRNADALMGMAEAQKYQGNTGKARHYYQRYLELHPQGPDAAVARRNLKEL